MLKGIFMCLISVIIGFSSGAFKKVPNQRRTKGTIDSLEQNNTMRKDISSHTGIVSYEVEGKGYTIKTSHQSSFFVRGKKQVVCYDAENPQNAFIKVGMMIQLLMAASTIAGVFWMIEDIISLLP